MALSNYWPPNDHPCSHAQTLQTLLSYGKCCLVPKISNYIRDAMNEICYLPQKIDKCSHFLSFDNEEVEVEFAG